MSGLSSAAETMQVTYPPVTSVTTSSVVTIASGSILLKYDQEFFETLIPGTGCPATIGFWKHHAFPASVASGGLTIGGVSYTPAQWLTILKANGGNAVAILGRQLVGALLNLAAGAVDNPTADAAIAAAETLLSANSINLLTSNVNPNSTLGQALLAQATILDSYNNGNFGTCSDGTGMITGQQRWLPNSPVPAPWRSRFGRVFELRPYRAAIGGSGSPTSFAVQVIAEGVSLRASVGQPPAGFRDTPGAPQAPGSSAYRVRSPGESAAKSVGCF